MKDAGKGGGRCVNEGLLSRSVRLLDAAGCSDRAVEWCPTCRRPDSTVSERRAQEKQHTTQTNTTKGTQVCHRCTRRLLSPRHAYSLQMARTHTHTHSSFSDLHSHTHSPIWRGAAFRSRWRLHVSTAKGATGLQQTSVLVMVVVVLGVRDEEGRREEEAGGRGRASASACSGGEPLPE